MSSSKIITRNDLRDVLNEIVPIMETSVVNEAEDIVETVAPDIVEDYVSSSAFTSAILDVFYPVGSYYETSDTTFNPNISWGGTWEEITDYIEEKALLWTNSSTTSQFATQTVTLDLSPYDQVEVEVIDYISYQDSVAHLRMSTVVGAKAIATTLLSGSGQHGSTPWHGNRMMDIVATGVHFDAGYGAAGTGNYSVRNDALIPYKIIGVKFVNRWHRTA